MLKRKKKGHCVDLIPFNTSGIFFCISDSRSEVHMQKRDPKIRMNMDKSVSGWYKCPVYVFRTVTLVLLGRKLTQTFLMHSWGTQLSKAETPWGSEELQSTSQGFLDINLHGIVIIAFELFICIWHQDWDPQLCRHCNDVKHNSYTINSVCNYTYTHTNTHKYIHIFCKKKKKLFEILEYVFALLHFRRKLLF